ncbi:glucose-1-phosphate thymidylyltransferase [Salinarchaeum sp. Harcht-Bsk1]|uniref:nucleotidyltransferase family protein n=1 Tax=Salinarchaeum sp. Harcht-Bsk1 TaxID=1333523 RepID=UPI0003423DBE|nr:nucleotidyltransferase family protein [Salinarchaeum sp. Harcht-Bsk1]AGN00914.1 glucose-1-phosphate thymidylyltransferase [Salinarchaeum sp. Harcht-Bsk1]
MAADETREWTAIVPAAGEGTRLRPLTAERPKPLVAVAGKPLLAHVFDALAPIDPASFVVVVGYRGEQVRAHFSDSYGGVPIEYVHQPEPRGLADAVGRAAPVVDGPALVCNGDNVFATDLEPLAAAHEAADGDPVATMLVEEASVETARETGVVVTDEAGRVERVVEKPDSPPSTLVSAGAIAVEPSIFEAIDAIEPANTGEYELADSLTWLLDRGETVHTHRYVGERVNVNAPADVELAEAVLANR